MKIDLDLPKPFAPLLEPKRYKIYHGGRSGGKSWAFARVLLLLAMQRHIRVLCVREFMVSIRESVHKLLCDQIESLGLNSFYEVTRDGIRCTITGSEFIFKGMHNNTQSIKSTEGVNICWVEEAQTVSDASWEALIPTIRMPQSEIWLSLNPRYASDATYRRFVTSPPDDDMVRVRVLWSDNPFHPEVLEKERIKLERDDPAAYRHVWLGELDNRYFGGIYAKQVDKAYAEKRVTDRVKHDPAYPVHTAWDLGEDDATCIWFYQQGAGEAVVLDYYENSNMEGIGHYCDVLKARAEDGRWRYGAHNVPSDAGFKLQAAGGKSLVEIAKRDHGVVMTVWPETTHVNRQEAARKVLPKCWFSPKCSDGLNVLMNYRYEYDEDKKTFKPKPLHDWASHGSTAFEILARAFMGKEPTLKETDTRSVIARFKQLQSDHGVSQRDPYRIKPV